MLFLIQIVPLGLFFGSDTMQQTWDGLHVLYSEKTKPQRHNCSKAN
jgi:hypothetical protein